MKTLSERSTITFDTYGSGVPVEVIAEILRGLFDGNS